MPRTTIYWLRTSDLSLTEVQYALSIEYGFRSWNELRERILAAENENLSARATALVRKAREHFATKGPARDATGSEWDRVLFHLTSEFQAAGEDGYLADLELSRSENARARKQAAIGFGIRRDARSKEQLVRLLNDRKHKVRHAAAKALGVVCPGCGAEPTPL